MEIDPQAIGAWVKVAGDALSALVKAKDALPKGKDRDQVEGRIREAEKALGVAQAEVASRLGYVLCRCTFPPEIMLETGSPRRPRCPKCNRVEGADGGGLSDEADAILRVVTTRMKQGISAEEVAAMLNLHPAKAEYHLEALRKAKMIDSSLSMGRAPEYYTIQRGREYLVERGVL